MSMASSSDNTSMCTPAPSTTGSLLDNPFEDDASLSTIISRYKGPTTVLATFFYRFTTFLSNGTQGILFGMYDHPVDWPNILRVNGGDWRDRIRVSINGIATHSDGAAELLLVIFWSYILKDDSDKDVINSSLWAFVREYAANTLFKFQNAPDQYLGWVKDVNPRNKGHLRNIVSEDGQKYFTVDSQGHLTWLSDSEGLELAKNTIGKLAACPLNFV